MEGIIYNFRRGRHHVSTRQMLLKLDNVEDKAGAVKLIGKNVIWKSPAGKEIKGKISGVHGNKGNVKIIFEKGMPGQSIGTRVKIE